MRAFSVEFTRSAEKEFAKLSVKIRGRISEAINVLAQNPYSELLKTKKLKGADDLYRIRVGDYRVVYSVRNETLVVIIIKIGNRREVYR